MSTKENNSEVAVEKTTENNDKSANDVKCDVKGTKRPAEVSNYFVPTSNLQHLLASLGVFSHYSTSFYSS